MLVTIDGLVVGSVAAEVEVAVACGLALRAALLGGEKFGNKRLAAPNETVVTGCTEYSLPNPDLSFSGPQEN